MAENDNKVGFEGSIQAKYEKQNLRGSGRIQLDVCQGDTVVDVAW